jgi:UDP-3-O-[3-hydroxymyristoyl] glucosamine N-acyltransferase
MADPVFFAPVPGLTAKGLAESTGALFHLGEDGLDPVIHSVAPIENAGSGQLTFLDNPAYSAAAGTTLAAAIVVAPKFADRVNPARCKLVIERPYAAYARMAAILFPSSMRPQSLFAANGVSPGSIVHPSARLEPDVTVDPGVVIGPGAEIGSGTIIAANAVIGPNVRIGRDCAIGGGVVVTNSLIGNRVIVHNGVKLGQDGFGFAMGAQHLKVPQLGRVIVQDDVEIGANTTIDRGTTRDTVIGEGTKIDNLVQIGHNASIGRHCVIVGQVGIAGSAILEDYVVIGGQAGVAGHIRVGKGAQIAGDSKVASDLAAGGRYGGAPAKPFMDFARELAAVKRLARPEKPKS